MSRTEVIMLLAILLPVATCITATVISGVAYHQSGHTIAVWAFVTYVIPAVIVISLFVWSSHADKLS